MRALWTALALVLVPALLVPASSAAGRKPKFDKQGFKLEYRSALDRLARGEAEGSLTDLIALESRVGAGTDLNLEPMWTAKLSVIRDLLKAGPEVLVPVSQFHERAYIAHLERGSRSLAAHSRSMTIELAELYAERVEGTHGDRVASALLTSMAGHLHATFMDPNAAKLYRRAADIDPTNAAALLGLAGIFERHGDYERALPVLEELARVAPENPEGRLRLAVNLTRAGQPDRAEAVLRGLAAEEVKEPRWVHSLAYQELGRILIDREAFAEAAALIEGAVRALPGDPTLPILLAYASDRTGHPSRKAELTAGRREADRSGQVSPRYRYSQMPQQALQQLRVALRGESSAQLPTLAEALSGRPVLAAAGSR